MAKENLGSRGLKLSQDDAKGGLKFANISKSIAAHVIKRPHNVLA